MTDALRASTARRSCSANLHPAVEAERRLEKTFLTNLALHDATAVFLCLRPLPPRSWWHLRSLSRSWQLLLDGGAEDVSMAPALLSVLVRGLGPLRTANAELQFAGAAYAAVHLTSGSAIRHLLGPLSCVGWARPAYASAVAREVLTQAALSGNAENCRTILESTGGCLSLQDATDAIQAAEEWHVLNPQYSADSEERGDVNKVLKDWIPSQVCLAC